MEEKHLSFSFKGHYFKIGTLSSATKEIWFVLHGYGQLARYFIQKFKALEKHNICVIAPEGLSHFYLEPLENTGRKNNRVGATWMTRENRLIDIENYLTFLNRVYDEEVNDRSIPVSVLGFSQGSATASRWVADGKINFQRLILWAGIFPPDMDFVNSSLVLRDKKVVGVYGTKDPFVNDERFAELSAISSKLRTSVDIVKFEGGHEIDEQTLVSLLR